MEEALQIRIQGSASLPTLVYLPGMHGDWTLVSRFRAEMKNRVRWVEFTYPRTLNWALSDYSREIENTLLEHQIQSGWLLGESFGSQLIWPMFSKTDVGARQRFRVEGIVLAGGFARHPAIWGVRVARAVSYYKPGWVGTLLLALYARYARCRHGHSPDTLTSIEEFVARRTALDAKAIHHRLRLVAENDPCELVRSVSCPVYHLSGLFDPIVPWFPVQNWLRKNCSTLRGTRLIWGADHNVLGTAPVAAAAQIVQWIQASARCS